MRAVHQGFTPLHTAAAHSSQQAAAVMGNLLEAGADLEAPDQAGRTPLLLALEGNRKDAISTLLAAGGGLQSTCQQKDSFGPRTYWQKDSFWPHMDYCPVSLKAVQACAQFPFRAVHCASTQ